MRTFLRYQVFIVVGENQPTLIIMEKKYKREYRELRPETIEKLKNNASLKRAKSEEHKQHISQGLKKYWSGVPSRDDVYTMTDLINGKEV